MGQDEDVDEATLNRRSNNNNNIFQSGGNRTIPEVREDSVDDFGVGSSGIKVPPQLPKFSNIEQEMWNEQDTPERQQKLKKPTSLFEKRDQGFFNKDE